MTSTRRPLLLLTSVSVLLASGVVAPRRARADSPFARTIDAQLFQPAIGPRNFLTLEGTDVPDHKRLSFGLTLNYQSRPYSTYTQGTAAGTAYLIDNQFGGELDAAIGLFDRFQVGLGLPYTAYLSGDAIDAMGAATGGRLTENGIGDMRLEAKAQLAALGDDDQYSFAASGGITLPTSKSVTDSAYLGDKNVTGRLKGIGMVSLGHVRAAANLGLLFRGTSYAFATQMSHQVLYGAAAAYDVGHRVEVILELAGRSGIPQFNQFYTDVNPFEVDIAGRWGVTSMVSVLAGGGKGLGTGIGAPQLRLFAGVQFNPDFRDRDHDGVYDVDDKCPDQPEDRDGFQDQDGCPDPDNDNDGIPDAQDKCPNDPEDLDQFEDEDGCPDPDNDKDGIPDLNDACPNAPEDGKGKRPHDGCPSTSEDSDGDGVPDAIDKCPDDPEDRDGFQDDDGCPDLDNDNDGSPDPGAEIVHLLPGKIEVDDRIAFGGSKSGKAVLRESSARNVRLVGLVMKGHTEIKKLRIEVRADGVSKNETQARADAIKETLVAKGVDAARLEAVGMGGGGSRVDFLITEMAAAPKAPGQVGDAPKIEAPATP